MKLELTPEVLKSQAGQMESLMNDYDALFQSVTSTLNHVNHNWSENLSNNFSSKIASAQKSFASILNSLEFGAKAANASAMSFEDIDSQLAKAMNGDSKGNNSGANGKSGYVDGASETFLDNLFNIPGIDYDKIIADYKATKGDAKAIKDFYENLPKPLKDALEKTLGKENTGAIKVVFDILSGDISLKTAKPLVKAILSEDYYKNHSVSTKFDLIVETFDTVLNQKGKTGQLMDLEEQLESIAHYEFMNGDYVGFCKDMTLSLGLGLLALPTGVAQIGTKVAVDFIDKPVQDIIKTTKFVFSKEEQAMMNVLGENADIVIKPQKFLLNGVETIWNTGTKTVNDLFK